MLLEKEFSREYQSRTIDCCDRFKFAEKLLRVYGYTQAVDICRKNHWNGVINSLNTIQGL